MRNQPTSSRRRFGPKLLAVEQPPASRPCDAGDDSVPRRPPGEAPRARRAFTENGTLCHVDEAQGRGDRLRRAFMLPILLPLQEPMAPDDMLVTRRGDNHVAAW